MKSSPAAVSSSKYRPPAERANGPFEEYEVREALSTLTSAEKIKRNRKLMSLCRKEAQRQLKAAQKDVETTKKL